LLQQQKDDEKAYLKSCNVHDPIVMKCNDEFIERESPISEKFYKLTREDDKVSADQLKPNKEEQKIIDAAYYKPLFLNLSDRENKMFWRYRYACSTRKELLPKFLLSVDWWNHSEADEAMKLLNIWADIDID
jgi:hypothetical protein